MTLGMPQDHAMEWLEPTRSVSHEYEGELLRFVDVKTDILVTPDHQMYFGTRIGRGEGRRLKWRLESAERLATRAEFLLYRSSNWQGNAGGHVQVGRYEVELMLFARFMGYYLSEGSVTGDQVSIAQRSGVPAFLAEQLEDLPWSFWVGKTALSLRDPTIAGYLRQFGKSHEKFVPAEILGASPRVIREFLATYIFGDGSVRLGKGFGRRIHRSYFTSSPRMAAHLGELILKTGDFPSYFTASRAGSECFGGRYRTNHDVVGIRETRSRTTTASRGRSYGLRVERVPYSGSVHCVELPRNHVFLVRRSGKVAWCGNCRCAYGPALT